MTGNSTEAIPMMRHRRVTPHNLLLTEKGHIVGFLVNTRLVGHPEAKVGKSGETLRCLMFVPIIPS